MTMILKKVIVAFKKKINFGDLCPEYITAGNLLEEGEKEFEIV